MKKYFLKIFYSIDRHLNISQRLKNDSILKNVLIAYILMVIIPTGIVLFLYYNISVSSVEHEMSESIYKTAEQASQHIDLRLASIEEISNDIFMNPMYNNAFAQNGTNPVYEQIDRYNDLNENIEIIQRREDIKYVKLYFKKSRLYTNEHVNFFNYSEIENESWMSEVKKKNGAIAWIGAREQQFSDGSSERVLTCARLIKNQRDINKVSGALLIDVKESNIRRILEETRTLDAEEIFLFNKDEECMADYSIDGDTTLKEARAQCKRKGIRKENNKYYISVELENSGWHTVMVVPQSVVKTSGFSANKFLNVLLFTVILVLFAMAFFVMFGYLIMRVTWRIKKIVYKMEHGGIERIKNEKDIEKSDVNLLEKQVDEMISKVNELMQESYDAHIEKQKAELQSLHAQINPHFLYNTLDNISWMAMRANSQDVCDIIQELSQYFRLSLSVGRDVVPIESELKLAEVYIKLQNSRFQGIIKSRIYVDESLRHYAIPKLTLQPLLENAIIHGLQPKDDKNWEITVRGEEKENAIYLYVEDNGVGMEQNKTEFRPEGEHGYGLYSVNRRLQLYCGEEYGLKIISGEGKGASVCVALSKDIYRE